MNCCAWENDVPQENLEWRTQRHFGTSSIENSQSSLRLTFFPSFRGRIEKGDEGIDRDKTKLYSREGKTKQNKTRAREGNKTQYKACNRREVSVDLASDLRVNPVRLRNPLTIAPTLVSTSWRQPLLAARRKN